MVLSILLFTIWFKIIIKDRKDYFEWNKNYGVK